jgi:hypothetical protein
MRHSSLILLLSIVSSVAVAQENRLDGSHVVSAPAKIVAVNPNVHDIALSQTYDLPTNKAALVQFKLPLKSSSRFSNAPARHPTYTESRHTKHLHLGNGVLSELVSQ